jgi:hypothetical protein
MAKKYSVLEVLSTLIDLSKLLERLKLGIKI